MRRGGPNYLEGLHMMKECGNAIKVPMHVFGPDTDIVDIVPMALGAKAQEMDFDAFVNEPRGELVCSRQCLPPSRHARTTNARPMHADACTHAPTHARAHVHVCWRAWHEYSTRWWLVGVRVRLFARAGASVSIYFLRI